MNFLTWLEALAISRWAQESAWGSPILLCIHAVGMALVMGVILAVCLRVAGYPKGVAIEAYDGLLKLAWIGFCLNAASGFLIFMSNATRLIGNWTFDLKLVLILAGGLSLWALYRVLNAERSSLDSQGRNWSTKAKAVAGVTALFWIAAITSGRYIAYTLEASR